MSGSYPFIDIAALDSIREGFARGDAQVVLTSDLSSTLWVNGAGARLFGFDNITDMIGNRLELPIATRRQIAAATDETSIQPRVVSIRLGRGLRSELTQLQISSLTLPDGVTGLLLTAETQNSNTSSIIDGIGDETTHVALIDANCKIIAASAHFASLDISPSTLEDLAIEVTDAPEHTVKRRIRAGHHSVPGAMARLSDSPMVYLLCIVAEASDGSSSESIEETARQEVQSAPEKTIDENKTEIEKPQGFRFDRNAAPVRFIWKTDADAVIREISPELATIIGPNAADVTGRRFCDVATVFGFDPDNSITALLNKRDTWSGKRLMWPVEGTNLRVPVELAALPVHSRDRVFLGFRGFGLVRPTEVVDDPEEIGFALEGGIPKKQAPDIQPITKIDDDDVLALAEEVANDDHPTGVISKPALTITPTPGRRESDKVIELLTACAQEKVASDQAKLLKAKERQPRPEGGLTQTERNAFREIAERLRKQGLADTDTDHEPAEQSTKPSALVEKSEAQPVSPETEKVRDHSSADETVLLGNLPVPVIIHDGDEVLYANQALLDITGYKAIADIHDAGGVAALFNSESDDETGSSPRQSMVLRRADGSEQPIEAHLHAIAWRDSRALMLSLMPITISDNSPEAENASTLAKPLAILPDEEKQALQAHVDELNTILDTATDGVVLIDPQGRIRSMNHSAAALFGYERTDTEGKFFSMLFAIESQRAAMDYLSGLSGNGVLSVLNDGREVIGREAKGGFIPLFMTIGKLPQKRGFCAVLRDITQWKRTEEELTSARKEAERASGQKTEFLARISHEIRTPLNAIIGFSELMAEEKFGPVGNERYRDYLRDINRSGNHVLALVNDLLDISKIEAGGLDMQFEAVSLNDAIAEAIALMQPQANRERIIIRSSFQSNLPDIVADTRSIKQVALNLLSNAVRFTASGGQVIVSTSYEMNGDVVMRVRDTGIGMTQAEIEQALKPFRQINAAQRPHLEGARDWRNEGTGLGLPLTKAMVEANRAQFSIASTPGRGTVIEIIFPPTRVLAD